LEFANAESSDASDGKLQRRHDQVNVIQLKKKLCLTPKNFSVKLQFPEPL